MAEQPRRSRKIYGVMLVAGCLLGGWAAWAPVSAPQNTAPAHVSASATLRLVDRAQRKVKRRTGRYTSSIPRLVRAEPVLADRVQAVGLAVEADRDGRSYLATARQAKGDLYVGRMIGRTPEGELVRSAGEPQPLSDWQIDEE